MTSPPSTSESVPPGEAADIARIVSLHREIQEVSDRLLTPVPRGQHPKGHGCVKAVMRVDPDLPEDLRVGLFREPAEYEAIVRFSNGSSWDDTRADLHGMAIKALGVPGRKLLEGQEDATTQDFILVDQPTFFIRDLAEYVPVMRTLRSLKAPGFGLGKLLSLLRVILSPAGPYRRLRASRSKPDTPLRVRYWSTVPIAFGTRAAKLSAVPRLDLVPPPPPSTSPDRYREAMAAHLARGEARFDLLAQLQADPAAMPVEDPTVRWDESVAPFRKVATLVIPSQQFDTPEALAGCEDLSFNPWHALPEHRPLGGINRARRAVYLAISEGRHRLNGVPMSEPGAAP